MEDKKIVDLYYERSEIAISEIANKYGRYGKRFDRFVDLLALIDYKLHKRKNK